MSASSWTNGPITIRLADRGDLPDIAEMLADSDVARWLWFGPNKREDTEAFFGPYLDKQAGETAPRTAVFTVLRDDRYLGEGAVVEVEGSPDGFEIGYQLRREAWGRGVGKSLARFLVAYAVMVNEAYRIEADCLAGNAGSIAILEGLGLKQEGYRPGFRVMRGERHDEVLYGALVSDLDLEAIRRWGSEFGIQPAET